MKYLYRYVGGILRKYRIAMTIDGGLILEDVNYDSGKGHCIMVTGEVNSDNINNYKFDKMVSGDSKYLHINAKGEQTTHYHDTLLDAQREAVGYQIPFVDADIMHLQTRIDDQVARLAKYKLATEDNDALHALLKETKWFRVDAD